MQNQNDIKHFRSAYYSPVPRLLIAEQLRKYATACIDISDGLVADALHLSQASNVNLTINIDDIPISDQSQRWLLFQSDYDEALKNFLNWGDDDNDKFHQAANQAIQSMQFCYNMCFLSVLADFATTLINRCHTGSTAPINRYTVRSRAP